MIALSRHPYHVVLDNNIVRRQVVERRRARCCSIAQLEAGVVPGATDRVGYQYPLVKRSTIVGALPAHGEPIRLDVDEKHRLSKRVTREQTRVNTAGFYALGQVRPRQLNGIRAHFC
jgi:hypothetical protein